MIITTIISGLGNQLFQYAAGFGLARRRGTKLKLDTRFYSSSTLRRYELSRFDISAGPLNFWDRWRIGVSRDVPSNSWGNRVGRRLPIPRIATIKDKQSGFDPSVFNWPGDAVLQGYFQNEEYFADCAGDIRHEFTFGSKPDAVNEAMIDRIQSTPSICLHVRRGDYLGPTEVVGPCGLDYYERAISRMDARVEGAQYFVFSDDPDWARTSLTIKNPATFVTHNLGVNDGEDLRLMAACRHSIIANSSFSWWGAWLAQTPGQMVVAPAKWFKIPHGNESHIVPARWVRV